MGLWHTKACKKAGAVTIYIVIHCCLPTPLFKYVAGANSLQLDSLFINFLHMSTFSYVIYTLFFSWSEIQGKFFCAVVVRIKDLLWGHGFHLRVASPCPAHKLSCTWISMESYNKSIIILPSQSCNKWEIRNCRMFPQASIK